MILILLVLSFKLLFILLIFSLIFLLITQLIYLKLKLQHNSNFKGIKTLSFVHPFCADCGGGEKVLWRMITSLIGYFEEPSRMSQDQPVQKLKINIISGKKDNIIELHQKLKERFGIELNKDNSINNDNIYNYNSRRPINNRLVLEVELIPMKSGYMLRPKNFLTMFLQILGQIYFAFEIITKVYSDVYCDTTGLPFCYFVLKYFGHAKVTAYTHYPFISYEMLYQVEHNMAGVHSQGKLNKFKIVRKIKIFYYKLILKLYEFMGNKCLSFAYVNSTWTLNHMKELWRDLSKKEKLLILYPPCSISIYKEAAKNDDRQNIIVSFAQFRPEKRQKLQIWILAKLKEHLKNFPILQDLELHIIGGVRNENDQQILEELEQYSRELGVQEYVKFLPNGSIEQILEEFSRAKIAIHTMIAEHFGITLIEMMAAGLIIVTHNSAGAKDDILKSEDGEEKPGFLVNNDEGYISQIEEILLRYNEIKNKFISSSTRRAERFSDEAFKEHFIENLKEFLL
jgi:alpha-1,2-mannosyltransferase